MRMARAALRPANDPIFSPIAARLRERAKVYRSKGGYDDIADGLEREADEAEEMAKVGTNQNGWRRSAPTAVQPRPHAVKPLALSATELQTLASRCELVVPRDASTIEPLRAHNLAPVTRKATPPPVARPVRPPPRSASRAWTAERRTVNVDQACAIVGVARRTIYNWLKDGKVQFRRTVGGSIRIFEDSLWKEGHS